jgi:hypothetical protein
MEQGLFPSIYQYEGKITGSVCQTDALSCHDELKRIYVEIQMADRRLMSISRAEQEALEHMKSTDNEITNISALLKVCSAQLNERIESKKRRRELRRELECQR